MDRRPSGSLPLGTRAAGLAVDLAVSVSRHRLPGVLSAGLGAAAVAAYWYSGLVGLVGFREVTTGWSEFVAVAGASVALLCGLSTATLPTATLPTATLRRAVRRVRSNPTPRLRIRMP